MKIIVITVIVAILLLPTYSINATQENLPPWFFKNAYLNYTDVYFENSSSQRIVNISYKIISINGINFSYQVIPGNLRETNYTVNADLNHVNGFPALNFTDLQMLNKGNASFLNFIHLPWSHIYITVKTGIMAYTGEGIISSDMVIVKINSTILNKVITIYTNYSTYSGVLLNQKIKEENTTNYVRNLISTNIPLGILTWPQIIAEAFGFILIVIIAIYFIRRYRRTIH